MEGPAWRLTSKMWAKFLSISFLMSLASSSNVSEFARNTIGLNAGHSLQFVFNPESVEELETDHAQVVGFNVTALAGNSTQPQGREDTPPPPPRTPPDGAERIMLLHVDSADHTIATLGGNTTFWLIQGENNDIVISSGKQDTVADHGALLVKGHFLGRTELKFYNYQNRTYGDKQDISSNNNAILDDGKETDDGDDNSTKWKEMEEINYKISVIREDRVIDKIFIAVVTIFAICANIGMGCKVDLQVVKEVLRRPIAPVLGFFCQYVIMPLLSFGLIKLIGLSGGVALGFFAAGCAPGGTGSNMYTFLLDGDVSLSVTMTLISVLASLGMFPLWMYTLGPLVSGLDTDLHIPYQNIIISLFSLLVAVIIGVVIRLKRPKAAKVILRALKPFYGALILFMFTFGIYTNLYIFKLITPPLILAACLLPYVGFLVAGLVAYICRMPWQRVYTIAIETGIQNSGIAIVLMKFSLPQPEADLSLVSPVVVSMFTPVPLWIAITAYLLRKRCRRKKASDETAAEDGASSSGGGGVKMSDNEAEEQDCAEKDLLMGDVGVCEAPRTNGKAAPALNGHAADNVRV